MRDIYKVTKFSIRGGYGFCEGPDGKDIMVHAKWMPRNVNVLLPGWHVDADVEESDKGLRVSRIYRILPNIIEVTPGEEAK